MQNTSVRHQFLQIHILSEILSSNSVRQRKILLLKMSTQSFKFVLRVLPCCYINESGVFYSFVLLFCTVTCLECVTLVLSGSVVEITHLWINQSPELCCQHSVFAYNVPYIIPGSHQCSAILLLQAQVVYRLVISIELPASNYFIL